MADTEFVARRVTLARELKGWNQAQLARELELTAAAVSQFEGGVTEPSSETFQKLSDVLGVPRGFFELPVVETHEGFFRSLRRTSISDRRRARALAHFAHDLAISGAGGELPLLQLPVLKVLALDASDDEVEDAATRVRTTWGLERGPVRSMVGLLEDHGVVVIRLPLDTADVDAFSLPFGDRPVVVLSANKNDRARSRFDAAHELGHLVMHGESVWGMPEVEKQASKFAAAFLMPREDILEELPSQADWKLLFELKVKWNVSLAALLMRAKTLGKMSEASYLSAMKAVSARGWRRTEPVPLGPPEATKLLLGLVDQGAIPILENVLPKDVLMSLVGA